MKIMASVSLLWLPAYLPDIKQQQGMDNSARDSTVTTEVLSIERKVATLDRLQRVAKDWLEKDAIPCRSSGFFLIRLLLTSRRERITALPTDIPCQLTQNWLLE